MTDPETALQCAVAAASTTRDVTIAADALGVLPAVLARSAPAAGYAIVADANTWKAAGQRVAALLQAAGLPLGEPVVLAGDYNVVPTDDDIYNPKSWLRNALLQPQARALYKRLLAQGWLDALRAKHPDERIYTFWDYFRDHWKRDAGLRIDHLLLSRSLAPKLAEAGVDRWVRDRPNASDHAPTWIRIKMPR